MGTAKAFHHFRIDDTEYRFTHLSAADEFHCVRRVGPIVASTGALLTALAAQPGDEEGERDRLASVVRDAGPLLKAFAEMSEADADYVMTRCMAATEAKRDEAWVPVWDAEAGDASLDDLRMTDALRICYEVLREAVTAFFFDAASNFSALGLLRQPSLR